MLNVGLEEIPEIDTFLLEEALNFLNMKNSKASGEDRITEEMLKVG